MKLSNIISIVVAFGIGALAGAGITYKAVNTKLEKKYRDMADEEVNDMREFYQAKDKNREDSFEDRVREGGIKFAMEKLNLQREDGSSVYDTTDAEGNVMYEIIKPDDFGQNPNFEPRFLTLFADGWVAYDKSGELMEDTAKILGPDSLKYMGCYEPDTVYIRSHVYKKDYQVDRSAKTFEEVWGWDPAARELPKEDCGDGVHFWIDDEEYDLNNMEGGEK